MDESQRILTHFVINATYIYMVEYGLHSTQQRLTKQLLKVALLLQ